MPKFKPGDIIQYQPFYPKIYWIVVAVDNTLYTTAPLDNQKEINYFDRHVNVEYYYSLVTDMFRTI